MTIFLDQTTATPFAWEGELESLGESLQAGVAPPRISLGQPSVWDAATAAKDVLGQAWAAPQNNRAYWLLGLSCTLHPLEARNGHYTNARLEAYLRPRYGNGIAVAHDLLPLQRIVQEKGKLTVGLTPKLKFVEAIDVSLLEIGVEKEHTAVFPVIQAYGLGESNPYWIFEQHAQFPLEGSQKLYLLAAAPANVPLVLRLNLVATVKHRRWGIFGYGPPQSATQPLTFHIPPE